MGEIEEGFITCPESDENWSCKLDLLRCFHKNEVILSMNGDVVLK